jgi:hypothetical protein
MEVHAHTHTARKKWTHYLWEFLMLFLAVFCGFLAENIREHTVEKEKGRQYILSFYEDLRSDTTNMSLQIKELVTQDNGLNNIFNCFDSVTEKSISPDCLRDIITNASGFSDFIYTDRTIQQLKYSGGLRLIQDKEIADSIIRYDASVRELLIHQEVLEGQQQNAINAHNEMIGFGQLQDLKTGHNEHLNIKDPLVKNGFLMTTDRREINKYFNIIGTFKKGCYGQLRRLRNLKVMATGLLLFLDKKGFKK